MPLTTWRLFFLFFSLIRTLARFSSKKNNKSNLSSLAPIAQSFATEVCSFAGQCDSRTLFCFSRRRRRCCCPLDTHTLRATRQRKGRKHICRVCCALNCLWSVFCSAAEKQQQHQWLVSEAHQRERERQTQKMSRPNERTTASEADAVAATAATTAKFTSLHFTSLQLIMRTIRSVNIRPTNAANRAPPLLFL